MTESVTATHRGTPDFTDRHRSKTATAEDAVAASGNPLHPAYADDLRPSACLIWPQDGQGSGGDHNCLSNWGRALGSNLRLDCGLAAGSPGFGRGTVLLPPLDKPSAAQFGRSGLTSGQHADLLWGRDARFGRGPLLPEQLGSGARV